MKSIKFAYYPILILLTVFFLDKLILLPPIQKCCVSSGLAVFYQNNFDNVIEDKIKKAKTENKKIALNFGSSLSFGFYFNHHQRYLDSIPECANNQKCFHADWEIINIAIPGATMLSHYANMNRILKLGIQPDLILIELAPNSFNKNSPWHKSEVQEAMSLLFALEHIFEIPFEHFRSILFTRMFAFSRYKITTNTKNENLVREYYKKFLYDYSKEKEAILPESFQTGDRKKEISFSNQFLLSALRETFAIYSVDPNLKQYYYLIVKETGNLKIPLYFWYPALHPSTKAITEIVHSKPTWKKFLTEIEENQINYINLNDLENNKCDKFLDVIHMGIECFGNVFLLASKQNERNFRKK